MNCLRCKYGPAFPEGHLCARHATPEQAGLVAQLDRRAAAIGIPKTKDWAWGFERAWPYGPNLYVEMRVAMLRWAEANQLKLTPQTKRCLCWIRSGRRCDYRCARYRWMDHVTGWQRAGKPALLLAQPYGVDISVLTDLANDSKLRVYTGGTGWYGHGTVAIEVWRRDAPDMVRLAAPAVAGDAWPA